MFSGFVIDRLVFAWMIAIILVVVGALSITSLQVAQYPSIAPHSIFYGYLSGGLVQDAGRHRYAVDLAGSQWSPPAPQTEL